MCIRDRYKLIVDKNYDLSRLDRLTVSENAFDSYEPDNLKVTALLYQAGYLTVSDVLEHDLVVLDFPNYEVARSFSDGLLGYLTRSEEGQNIPLVLKLRKLLEDSELEEFFEELRYFFADVPYDMRSRIQSREQYYQSVLYLFFKLMSLETGAEVRTNRGRIDIVVEAGDRIYLMELKTAGTPEEAINQMKEKKYHEKYLGEGKAVSYTHLTLPTKA